MVRIAPGPRGRIPVYGATKEEADRKKQEVLADLKTSEATPDLLPYPPGSLAEFVYTVWVPRVYKSVRPSTRRSYDSILVRHILPTWGHLQISEIGYSEVESGQQQLRRYARRKQEVVKTEEPLPDRRRFEVVMRLREILGLHHAIAGARGLPVRFDWRLSEPPPKKRKEKRPEPEPDFVPRLIAAANGTIWLGPIVACLFVGLRRGEICGLKRSHLDRDRMILTVCEQKTPETGDSQVATKGQERSIPIPSELIALLDAFGRPDSEYFFPNAEGGALLPNQLSKAIPALCAKAGLTRMKLHWLRAFAASNLAALGVDLNTIKEILGHTQIDTTLIYVDPRSEVIRNALRSLLSNHRPSTMTTGCENEPVVELKS